MNYLDTDNLLGYMEARATMYGYCALIGGGGALRALCFFKFASECRAFRAEISSEVSDEIQHL